MVKWEIVFSTFFTREKLKMLRDSPEIIIRNTWYSGQKAGFLISNPIFATRLLFKFFKKLPGPRLSHSLQTHSV